MHQSGMGVPDGSDMVGVSVGGRGVLVGRRVGEAVGVEVWVAVGVAVSVGVLVAVEVGVKVGVGVEVAVGVAVCRKLNKPPALQDDKSRLTPMKRKNKTPMRMEDSFRRGPPRF